MLIAMGIWFAFDIVNRAEGGGWEQPMVQRGLE